MAQRWATCHLHPPHVFLLHGHPAHQPRKPEAHLDRPHPSASRPRFLSCPPASSASPPLPRSSALCCSFYYIQPSVCSIHGGIRSPPCQPRRAHGHGQVPPPAAAAQEAAAAPAPARPPRLSVSPSPAAWPPPLRRPRDQGGECQDGRGDHREVRPGGRPLENIQLQGGGGGRGRGRGEDEVEDRPSQGTPGQVRRRVPGHLYHALPHLLHHLLPPHQRWRRRPAAAQHGWYRHGRDRRQGRDFRAGLRGAQGGVPDQVPAHGGADAGRRQLDREDQEGERLMHR